jgi:hypothetical protein
MTDTINDVVAAGSRQWIVVVMFDGWVPGHRRGQSP